VDVGDQYRRAGRGDNVSLYRANSIFPLSSVKSAYSFANGSITWPALALALGAYFRKAD